MRALRARVKPGQKIALTLGSRGINRIDRILRTVGKVLKDLKAEPYIVLGMGSHGGGTVEGQMKIAEKFGVTEATMGMPIKATMEVVRIGTTPQQGHSGFHRQVRRRGPTAS